MNSRPCWFPQCDELVADWARWCRAWRRPDGAHHLQMPRFPDNSDPDSSQFPCTAEEIVLAVSLGFRGSSLFRVVVGLTGRTRRPDGSASACSHEPCRMLYGAALSVRLHCCKSNRSDVSANRPIREQGVLIWIHPEPSLSKSEQSPVCFPRGGSNRRNRWRCSTVGVDCSSKSRLWLCHGARRPGSYPSVRFIGLPRWPAGVLLNRTFTTPSACVESGD